MAPAAVPLRRHAWAKVNLYLEITGRRPDGYHELDSLVVFVGLADLLELRPSDRLELHCSGPFAGSLPPTEDNLVMRAARALAAQAGTAPAARIDLNKQIPAAAGIGGGSADAAAALEGLAALWGLRPSPEEMHDIAVGLGADVPVCLYGRPALVRGLGEVVERAPPLPGAWLVLVNPGRPLSTQEVFRARTGAFSPVVAWTMVARDIEEFVECLADRANDLEAAALGLVPEIGKVLDRLDAAPGALLSRMSGSGATCYGLFATAGEARAAAAAISAEQPNWWAKAAPMLHGKLAGGWRD